MWPHCPWQRYRRRNRRERPTASVDVVAFLANSQSLRWWMRVDGRRSADSERLHSRRRKGSGCHRRKCRGRCSRWHKRSGGHRRWPSCASGDPAGPSAWSGRAAVHRAPRRATVMSAVPMAPSHRSTKTIAAPNAMGRTSVASTACASCATDDPRRSSTAPARWMAPCRRHHRWCYRPQRWPHCRHCHSSSAAGTVAHSRRQSAPLATPPRLKRPTTSPAPARSPTRTSLANRSATSPSAPRSVRSTTLASGPGVNI